MNVVSPQISCTWDDVKSLRQDMEKNTSAGTMHFRYKLLQAVSVLQVTSARFA